MSCRCRRYQLWSSPSLPAMAVSIAVSVSVTVSVFFVATLAIVAIFSRKSYFLTVRIKSVFAFWNFVHNVGARFRWCTISCPVKNPTTCNLGPVSLAGYSYSIMKIGPLQFTRKGLSVASTAACLTFTLFQSASLCLATTTLRTTSICFAVVYASFDIYWCPRGGNHSHPFAFI